MSHTASIGLGEQKEQRNENNQYYPGKDTDGPQLGSYIRIPSNRPGRRAWCGYRRCRYDRLRNVLVSFGNCWLLGDWGCKMPPVFRLLTAGVIALSSLVL